MIFGTPQKNKNIELEITFRHHTINNTSTYKYLGVSLDRSLNLIHQNNVTYKKALGRLYLLQRLRPQLTVKAAATIYESMLVPLFTYCSLITCQTSNTYKNKVKSFEKRARDIICKGNMHQTSLPTIENIINKRLCQNVYKCLTGDVCEILQTYFEIMNNNTRNKGILIRLPKVKLECYKKSFYFNGAKCFNQLPSEVRAAENFNDFNKFFE
jgi:hypothetical protein